LAKAVSNCENNALISFERAVPTDNLYQGEFVDVPKA